MNETGVLRVERRTDTSSQANKRLRKAGYLPGNIFGKDMESIAVTIRMDELRRNIVKYGRSAVFELVLDEKEKFNVMVKDVQFTHVSHDFMHVDFHSISLSEETKANVPIRVVGDELYEARKLLLQLHRDIVPVKGLPQDVPNFIEVNVKELNLGDNLYISNLEFPSGIVPELDEAQLVISVSEAKVHKEVDEETEEDVAVQVEE